MKAANVCFVTPLIEKVAEDKGNLTKIYPGQGKRSKGAFALLQ
jgi:hypothetical protein